MTPLLEGFAKELEAANEKYADLGLNAPTRAVWLLQLGLLVTDGFKLATTGKCALVTEEEFLRLAREAYWKARALLQVDLSGNAPPAQP